MIQTDTVWKLDEEKLSNWFWELDKLSLLLFYYWSLKNRIDCSTGIQVFNDSYGRSLLYAFNLPEELNWLFYDFFLNPGFELNGIELDHHQRYSMADTIGSILILSV